MLMASVDAVAQQPQKYLLGRTMWADGVDISSQRLSDEATMGKLELSARSDEAHAVCVPPSNI